MKNIALIIILSVLVSFVYYVSSKKDGFFIPSPLAQFEPIVVPTTHEPVLEDDLPFQQPGNRIPLIKNSSEVIKDMKLTFNEEFGSLSLYTDQKGNTTCSPGGKGIWQTVYHFCSRTISANKEAQIYVDNNFLHYMNSRLKIPSSAQFPFSIKNGILSITISPSDDILKAAAGSWAKYTSGLLTTEFSFSQMYGYFEMRAKMPVGRGLWPAFWLLPIDRSWPPEIDVMEAFGGTNDKDHGPITSVHYASHLKDKSKYCGDWVDIKKDISRSFHTYGVNWQKDKITYYFDGVPYASCPGNDEANKPFYMLVNVAVGGEGSWPGTPNSENKWPAVMEVDYIRAFK